jgi:twitching motility protein PilJ
MTSGTDYTKLYGQAHAAYCQGDLETATNLIDRLREEYPNDPNVLLLRGHTFVSLQQYERARQQYESARQLTDQPDLLDCINQSLEQISQLEAQDKEDDFQIAATEGVPISDSESNGAAWNINHGSTPEPWQEESSQTSWTTSFDGIDWDSMVFEREDLGEPTLGQSQTFANPFEEDSPTSFPDSREEGIESHQEANPYNPFSPQAEAGHPFHQNTMTDNPASTFSLASAESFSQEIPPLPEIDGGEATFVVSSPEVGKAPFPSSQKARQEMPSPGKDPLFENAGFEQEPTLEPAPPVADSQTTEGENFLENWEALREEDLGDLSQFDLTNVNQTPTDATVFNNSGVLFSPPKGTQGLPTEQETRYLGTESTTGPVSWLSSGDSQGTKATTTETWRKPKVEVEQGRLAWLQNAPLRRKPWLMAGLAGLAAALAVFLVSGIAWLAAPQGKGEKVATPKNKTVPEKVTSSKPGSSKSAPPKSAPPQVKPAPGLSPFSALTLYLMLGAGGAGFVTVLLLAQVIARQTQQTVEDLHRQFDAIYTGDFNVKATLSSEDELGQLAAHFNQIARVISTTTSEAQRRAAQTEQSREDLQRQVIRLLDDVEGAARGDLTVHAEVTADVLGAVADAFNLTIDNLREIIRQVKQAAKQVNRACTDSEFFARTQSSEALRTAEELAATLNSVQMMTESIQRVAENAREAEEVTRSSSVTALKGGEAVERTVVGILQIRETVSETTRKVKRLAEASQEISKIVTLISQIASRTNLLALNASIQAAKAGEAGRGFAIVANEVRQLADRSAKSLREIEQIVLQIQSETGSVMTAMEEGIQQVIDVAEKSEQAKASLDDIIEVANRINALVCSISADTVKQRENSRSVAQVMQEVEKTAQGTSQESQHVAGALQNLVSISRNLLESVERFRVDPNEK